MGLLPASFLIFRAQLVALARSRRALVCALLAAGPIAAAWLAKLVSAAENEFTPVFEIGWMLIVQSTVPLIALIVGAAVVAEEIEDRTITYLFTRPIPRAAVLCGRLAAGVLLVELLIGAGSQAAIALLQSAAGPEEMSGLPAGMAGAMRNAAMLGGLVYTVLFAVAGALFRHPMIVGIGYAFVIEGFIANLPGENPSLTIQFHLKSRLAGLAPEYEARMQHFVSHQVLLPPDDALQRLWIVCAVALALGILVVSRKQFVLSS